MATTLDKEIKRQVSVEGAPYTVALSPDGMRITAKGKRKPEVELRWTDLLNGEAAMAVALQASLRPRVAPRAAAPQPAIVQTEAARKKKKA